ncbi:hypothetical protein F4802DRAFT_559390 [Xylaria palmicola]|nr:hypothetical protein F4802DRAFT_559390 [Xylaria palmicola]
MARIASVNSLAALLLLVLLSLSSVASAAAVQFRTAVALTPRQSPAAATPAATVSCADYSRVANLSTIALNSTLRGAFLRSSSLGTFPAAAILDRESPRLPGLKFDAALNQQCGNLSALALVEADRNLTAGVVAGLRIREAPGVAPGNLALPILCVLFIIMMGVPASAL